MNLKLKLWMLHYQSFKETQFQTEEMQNEFKISRPMEFVAQQPAQITSRSPRLAELKSEPTITENSKCLENGILEEC